MVAMRVHLRQETEVSEKATPYPTKRGGRDVHIKSESREINAGEWKKPIVGGVL